MAAWKSDGMSYGVSRTELANFTSNELYGKLAPSLLNVENAREPESVYHIGTE
jgi:hypothetical protein